MITDPAVPPPSHWLPGSSSEEKVARLDARVIRRLFLRVTWDFALTQFVPP